MLTEVIAHCRSWVSMMVLVFNLESRRSRSGILIVLLAAMALTGCTPSFDEDLAFRHAPVHFQDTDDTNAVADFITAVDYDGARTGSLFTGSTILGTGSMDRPAKNMKTTSRVCSQSFERMAPSSAD